ncbi:MAG: hypothetical protein V9F82_00060 [Dermatophilaceae bacterium]
MTAEEIVKNYVFLTAGACGPCRFGMYVTEYRKALRDAGFDGFRVHALPADRAASSRPRATDVGPRDEPRRSSSRIIKAHRRAATCSTRSAYRIRPYEVEPGATDRALESAKQIIYDGALRRKTSIFRALLQVRAASSAAVKVDKLRAQAEGRASSASSGR